MKIFSYLIIAFITITIGCFSDETIPPITTENTFSCRINDDVFLPKDHGSLPVIKRVLVSLQVKMIGFLTFKIQNSKSQIKLYLKDVTHTGTYDLSLSDGNKDLYEEDGNKMVVDLATEITQSTHFLVK
ncbi:hypothetical protein [Formosa haliotis]|uniref:hypothetical protein n=1 Tax=Formosa haliotis TaxID=1555194 RepID=UPI000826D10C|nr:hypothetical protein [Formosa haliotis]